MITIKKTRLRKYFPKLFKNDTSEIILTSSVFLDKVGIEINLDKDEHMKNMKWPFITTVVSSIGIFSYLLLKHSLTSLALTDTYFIVSLFFLIIGIALWIMSSGFFDTFQRSMKMHFRLKKKKEQEEYIPFSVIGKEHRFYWLLTGSMLLILAVISLLFYFL